MTKDDDMVCDNCLDIVCDDCGEYKDQCECCDHEELDPGICIVCHEPINED